MEVAADLSHQAAARTPRNVDIRYGAALLDRQVENLTRASEHLQQALTTRPNFGVAHLNLGVILVRQGIKSQFGCHFGLLQSAIGAVLKFPSQADARFSNPMDLQLQPFSRGLRRDILEAQVDVLKALEVTREEAQLILGENSARLLRLDG